MSKLCSLFAVVVFVSGCATAPNWQHPQITDETAMSKQLKIDDGYCLLVANGAAPMPSISTPTPSTTSFYAQGRSYDQRTGTWTNSTLSGQTVTVPSGGFAGGVAAGLNNSLALGAVLEARHKQDAIHQACMLAKGWVDLPHAQEAKSANKQPRMATETPSADEKKEWLRDVDEFLLLYPSYKKPGIYERLDSVVRTVATQEPSLSGKQVLLKARAQLAKEGVIVEPATDASLRLAALSYADAVTGNTNAQLAMTTAYGARNDQESQERLTYWASLAARSGSPDGKIILGLQLFHGKGIAQDRVSAYRLIEQAALTSLEAAGMLPKIKAALSTEELARLQNAY